MNIDSLITLIKVPKVFNNVAEMFDTCVSDTCVGDVLTQSVHDYSYWKYIMSPYYKTYSSDHNHSINYFQKSKWSRFSSNAMIKIGIFWLEMKHK